MSKASPAIPTSFTPDWYGEWKRNFRDRTSANVFVMHGNITDYADQYGSVASYWLAAKLIASGYTAVVLFSQSRGWVFPDPVHGLRFAFDVIGNSPALAKYAPKRIGNSRSGRNAFNDDLPEPPRTGQADGWAYDLPGAFAEAGTVTAYRMLDSLLALSGEIIPARDDQGRPMTDRDGKLVPAGYDKQNRPLVYKVAVILPYAERLIYEARAGGPLPTETHIMSELTIDWSTDRRIRNARSVVFLFTPEARTLPISVRNSSVAIRIRVPNYNERASLINALIEEAEGRARPILLQEDMSTENLVHMTSGLTYAAISHFCAASSVNQQPISPREIREVKQEVVARISNGTLALEEPEGSWDWVVGLDPLVKYFQWVSRMMRAGDKRTPRGIILAGPPGTGKTLLARIAARESQANYGFTNKGMLLGGIVGETEARTELFFQTVIGFSPMFLVLDEVETWLQRAGQGGDSGTSAGVFGAFLRYLGDESLAGRLFVVACTNKPSELDTAIVDRLGDIVPVLPSLDAGIRSDMFQKQALFTGIEFAPDVDFERVGELTAGLTGRDMRNGIKSAFVGSGLDEREVLDARDVELAIRNKKSRRDQYKRDELVKEALDACTNWQLVNPEWRPDDLQDLMREPRYVTPNPQMPPSPVVEGDEDLE